jgi:hypothetical protein
MAIAAAGLDLPMTVIHRPLLLSLANPQVTQQ